MFVKFVNRITREWVGIELFSESSFWDDPRIMMVVFLNLMITLYIVISARRNNEQRIKTDNTMLKEIEDLKKALQKITTSQSSSKSVSATSTTKVTRSAQIESLTSSQITTSNLYIEKQLGIAAPFYGIPIDKLLIIYGPLFDYIRQKFNFKNEVIIEPYSTTASEIIVLKYNINDIQQREMLPRKICGTFEIQTQSRKAIRKSPLAFSEKEEIGNKKLPNYISAGVKTAAIQGGSEISNYNLKNPGAGTLGGILQDIANPTNYYGLTNYHVLSESQLGHAIEQPAWKKDPANIIGTTQATFGPMNNIPENQDYAIFKLDLTKRNLSPFMMDGITQIAGITSAQLGMKLKKFGRTTGLTHGKISGFSNQQAIVIRPSDAAMQVGIDIEISSPGDSGSIWLTDTMPTYAVGLHYGGESNEYSPGLENERAFAIQINTVIPALEKKLQKNSKLKFYQKITHNVYENAVKAELIFLNHYNQLKEIGLLDIPDDCQIVFVKNSNEKTSSVLIEKNEAVNCLTGAHFKAGNKTVGIVGKGQTDPFPYLTLQNGGISISSIIDIADDNKFIEKFSSFNSLPTGYKIVYTSMANSSFLELSKNQIKISGVGQVYGGQTNEQSMTQDFEYLKFGMLPTPPHFNKPTNPQLPLTPKSTLQELRQYLNRVGFFQGGEDSKLAFIQTSTSQIEKRTEKINFFTMGNNAAAGGNEGDTFKGQTAEFDRVCLKSTPSVPSHQLLNTKGSFDFSTDLVETLLNKHIPYGVLFNKSDKTLSRSGPITISIENGLMFVKTKLNLTYKYQLGFFNHTFECEFSITFNFGINLDDDFNIRFEPTIRNIEWIKEPVWGLLNSKIEEGITESFIEHLANQSHAINAALNLRFRLQSLWNNLQEARNVIENLYMYIIPVQIKLYLPNFLNNKIYFALEAIMRVEFLNHPNLLPITQMNILLARKIMLQESIQQNANILQNRVNGIVSAVINDIEDKSQLEKQSWRSSPS